MTHNRGIPVRSNALLPPWRPGLVILALCLLFLAVSNGLAATAPKRLVLYAPDARIDQGTVYVDLAVTVDSEEGLANMLRDGAVLSLGVILSMERERSWWANAEAAVREFSSNIRHDPLSRDFIVTLPTDSGTRELRDRSLPRLLYASWRKLELPLVTQKDLSLNEEPSGEYLINVTVTLHHTEVPPWLEKSILFWSSEVAPPEQRSTTFSLPSQ